jgi:conjugal transfer/entry exclusion protein
VKKKLALAAVLFALAATPRNAKAQFGFSIVYDPTNYGNAVLRYYELISQLQQLQATYAQVLNQYNLTMNMARNLPNMANRYATNWAPWRYGAARDVFGNTTGWINGVNTGLPPTVLSGYQNATNTLQTYRPSDLSSMDLTVRQQVESGYGTVELADGANQDAMDTMGAIRANSATTTNAIANIQDDSLSDDPTLNTEVSVLNKVNATNVLALQNAQDTNKLLVSILEQHTIAAKRLRDADTEAINDDIYRRANVVPMNSQLSGSFGSQLGNYRLP